ncbi:hypothetical protein BT67DRAFT_152422 [Trichocladium antarcticum]|uniref:Myb-like domain-containing protein n=1 Tax=Trichocladium antarcticum TaxID=1450529 RepID=A0AAN6UEN0_9PEZI|nr:hypothetical protein BT67DRAFT_152422 [Trichocladium antarcticum]
MATAMHMTGQSVPYAPTSDGMGRREYGVTKNRKTASTGGGRAWSEDEEVYLLQTRLQKMPYKHIAAHLKKTELACRLHYHQLNHGSNRRKRTTSISSGSSTSGQSPIQQTSIPSPIYEYGGATSRSSSPPESTGSYGSASPGGLQLPSIMSATASSNASPRLPTILPKPTSMTLALSSISASSSGTAFPAAASHSHPNHVSSTNTTGYRAPLTPTRPARPHSAHISHPHHAPGSLRLDCSALPPPPSAGATVRPPFAASHPVDMGRLAAVYGAHRASFWAAVAADYGPGANPHVLEQAWRGSNSNSNIHGSGSGSGSGNKNKSNGKLMNGSVGLGAETAQMTPLTPTGSPDGHVCGIAGGGLPQGRPDKTRISAILGIDANPRSPSEREMVRRIEEERCVVAVVGA